MVNVLVKRASESALPYPGKVYDPAVPRIISSLFHMDLERNSGIMSQLALLPYPFEEGAEV